MRPVRATRLLYALSYETMQLAAGQFSSHDLFIAKTNQDRGTRDTLEEHVLVLISGTHG
jgi:hypothetical protein